MHVAQYRRCFRTDDDYAGQPVMEITCPVGTSFHGAAALPSGTVRGGR